MHERQTRSISPLAEDGCNQAHDGTVAGEDGRRNRPMAGHTCGPVPAEYCRNLLCRGRHRLAHVVRSHRPSRLVQAGLLAFRQELSRPFRRTHFPAMFKDEGVDVLAAHHAAPAYLADLANLLRNHEPSATKASITGDLCSVRGHIVSLPVEGHPVCSSSFECSTAKRIQDSWTGSSMLGAIVHGLSPQLMTNAPESGAPIHTWLSTTGAIPRVSPSICASPARMVYALQNACSESVRGV